MELIKIESILWIIFQISSITACLLIIFDKVKTHFIEDEIDKTMPITSKKVGVFPEELINDSAFFSEEAQPKYFTKHYKQTIRKKIGEILLENGVINKEILNEAIEHSKRYGSNLTQYLLKFGHITENDLAKCLSTQFGVPYLTPKDYDISNETIKLISPETARKHWIVPLDKTNNVLTVAMIDPLDKKLIKQLEEETGMRIMPYVGIISEILSALQEHYEFEIGEGDTKIPPFVIKTMKYTGEERRVYLRYNTSIDIKFALKGKLISTKTLDVSLGGFSINSPKKVDLNTILTLELNLPKEINELPITAVAQVVRASKMENGEYIIGLRTLKIAKEDIKSIIDYARMQ